MYLALLNGLFLLRYGIGRGAEANRIAYWAVLFGLFLFSAFRFRVGCDWSGYYFNYLAGLDQDYDIALSLREPAWWVIQIAFNAWGLPYPSVNVLTSAIFFIGIHALARRQPDRLGFLVLLFPVLIINMPMSGIRQAAAIGFLCLAFVAFIEHRPVRFVAWILIGSTIHSSVLAFLLLTPLATGRYTTRRILLAAALALPGAVVLAQSDSAQVAIDRYVETGVDAFGAVFRVGVLAMTALFYFLMLRRRWIRMWPADYGLASIGAWIMLALLPLVGASTVVADRLGYFLVPIQTMIFARVPYLGLRTNRQLLSAAPYLGLVALFAVWSLSSGLFRACYLPYQSWLFGHPDFGAIGY